ncbi:sensor domain-containing diguanylate cyclase [Sulfurirhabdus autotrophica]|uniref:diguanylate cyclase n=1 Tax=Sulfurirhabdus autotrophica TaxID=1706046 RepID=A0A4R3XVZ2_9PROT|nr:diguanylate cyclase [Sulfurirhabdus autotrophica]TCV82981.1 diguanylate cyclase (GGDEF)-like protein [Sulfurirhabdus autotrophica]
MSKNFSFGLRGKLVVIVVTGIVIGFTIIGVFRLNQAKQKIILEMNRSGNERVTLIAEAFSNLIIGYDYSNMESLSERIAKQDDVLQIDVRNKAGKIMVSRISDDYTPSSSKDLLFKSVIQFGGEPAGSVELKISLKRLETTIHETYTNIILEQVFFAIFLSILIFVVTSRVIVKPIGHFRDLMNTILNNPSESSHQKLVIKNKDEIGDLALIFNSMNNQVHEYQQRLKDKYNLADSALVATNEQLKIRTADLEKALRLVEQLAITDSLTNLPNRRHFDDYLATTFSRAVRFKEPLCMILLDIDHFKQINDTHGHAAGDYVLKELGKLFKSRIRETDVCARLGGDEFAILLYRAKIDDAMNWSQLLLRIIREHAFTEAGITLTVTLSIGIAQITADNHSIEALYNATDNALYEAKRRGRNQAVIYPFE